MAAAGLSSGSAARDSLHSDGSLLSLPGGTQSLLLIVPRRVQDYFEDAEASDLMAKEGRRGHWFGRRQPPSVPAAAGSGTDSATFTNPPLPVVLPQFNTTTWQRRKDRFLNLANLTKKLVESVWNTEAKLKR